MVLYSRYCSYSRVSIFLCVLNFHFSSFTSTPPFSLPFQKTSFIVDLYLDLCVNFNQDLLPPSFLFYPFYINFRCFVLYRTKPHHYLFVFVISNFVPVSYVTSLLHPSLLHTSTRTTRDFQFLFMNFPGIHTGPCHRVQSLGS